MKSFIPLSDLDAPDAWFVRRTENISCSPERVWHALTRPAELGAWWCDEARIDLREGGTYSFAGRHAFGTHSSLSGNTPPGSSRGEGEAHGNFEILELAPEQLLRFRWWLGGVATEVRYELTSVLGSTELKVTQSAATTPFAELPTLSAKSETVEPNWWWVFLPGLRAYIEKGHAEIRLDFDAAAKMDELRLRAKYSTFPWVAWTKLTDATELERWWARKATIELLPGGLFDLGFDDRGARRVLECTEGERLMHDWHFGDGRTTRVSWSIQATDDDTDVEVVDLEPPANANERIHIAVFWCALLLAHKEISERGITPRDHHVDWLGG